MDCTQWWWGPPMHWFWVVPLVFMILMVVFVAFAVRRAGDWRSGHGQGGVPWQGWGPSDGPRARMGTGETPRQILDRRYASGELTKEQYEQMKRDLGLDGGSTQSP